MRSFTKVLITFMIILCLGVAGYSGWQILSKVLEYRRGDNTYEALEEHIDTDGGGETAVVRVHPRDADGVPGNGMDGVTIIPSGESTGAVPASDERADGQVPAPEDSTDSGQSGTAGVWMEKGGEGEVVLRIQVPQVDFDALLKENPDTVGWIFCPDTRINYPVVQGKTNDTYLHTMFNGEYNSAGSLFLDSANKRDFSDPNSIIYGHHMRNGSMFHDLINYKEKDFYEAHPYMIFLTPEKSYVVEVFSSFVASAYDKCWPVRFASEEERASWIRDIRSQSDFPSVLTPFPEDRFLTLSTCTYEFSEARYVVYGILTEIEELQDEEKK